MFRGLSDRRSHGLANPKMGNFVNNKLIADEEYK